MTLYTADTRTVVLQVDVTEADIAAGCAGVCEACPIALAVIRALQGCDLAVNREAPVTVTNDCVVVYTTDNRTWRGELDAHVEFWIRAFDNVGPSEVKPFSFELRLDGPWGGY